MVHVECMGTHQRAEDSLAEFLKDLLQQGYSREDIQLAIGVVAGKVLTPTTLAGVAIGAQIRREPPEEPKPQTEES